MNESSRKMIGLADGDVSCLTWSGDGPLLHFAHANGFNAQTYRSLLAPLSDRFAVAASDARGHGLTTLPATPGLARNWTIFRDDLIAVLDRIAPEGAILAGHSMGGTASLMAAALRPEKVRALVLVEPVLIPEGVGPGDNELARRAEKRRDFFASADEAFALYRGRGAFKTWPDEMLRDYLNGGLERTEAGFRLACRPAWEAEDFRSTPSGVSQLAQSLRCPVTLIHAKDGTASKSEVAIFKSLYPATRVVGRPDATHFLPMECPELMRDEITKIACPDA
jgi:pimeloyl-ACP methyl ester carboxylesterase